jgi:hypothetical protein
MEGFTMEEQNNVSTELQGDSAQSNESSKDAAIVFPDEKAFMSRVQREAKKQVQDFVKQLGFENDGQLKEVIQKQKQFEESQKTEYEKLQEQLQQKTEYINKVNENLKLNEVKMQALNAGIKPERLNHALKLLDVGSIEFVDGQLNTEQLNTSISSLLSEFPELKANNVPKSAGADFSQSKQQDFLTLDMIKSMSREETEKRLPEILKFLEKK